MLTMWHVETPTLNKGMRWVVQVGPNKTQAPEAEQPSACAEDGDGLLFGFFGNGKCEVTTRVTLTKVEASLGQSC